MPRTRSYHLHMPFWHVDNSANLRVLYGLRVISDVVNKAVIFYIPIFLYFFGLKSSWWQYLPWQFGELQKGLVAVALYFVVMRIAVLLTALPIGQFITKSGSRFSLWMAYFCEMIYLLLFGLSTRWPALIFLAAVFMGLRVNYYFDVFNSLLTKFAVKKHVGEDLSLLMFLVQITSAAAPALGGLAAAMFGYEWLFIAGIFGVLVSMGMVNWLDSPALGPAPTWREFKENLASKYQRSQMISYAGRYINDSAITIWPLYVMLLLGSVEKVGYLYSISLFLAVVIVFLTGFYIDYSKSRKPFLFSGGFLSLLWLARSQVTNFFTVALIDTFDHLTSTFHWLFYDSMLVRRGKSEKILAYYVYREVTISIFAIIFWLGVMGIFILPLEWNGLFALAAVGVLMSVLIKDHREHEQ